MNASNDYKDLWKYYNHALIPATAPHIPVDGHAVKSKWKNKKTFLIRWTTDFDCKYPNEWYFCIKDTPFDIQDLKSKQRYEITKGRKNFEIKEIAPEAYINEIFFIQKESFANYPKEYRPEIKYENIEREVKEEWKNKIVFAAFEKESNKMVSYCVFERHEDYIEWSVLKSIPQYERLKVNAAIICESLEYFNEDIKKGKYIHGGEKNISHQTNFQDYLEKLFGFRKAYCKLHIIYRPSVHLIVVFLYPFRKVLKKMKGRIFHNINSVLYMEKIVREQGGN